MSNVLLSLASVRVELGLARKLVAVVGPKWYVFVSVAVPSVVVAVVNTSLLVRSALYLTSRRSIRVTVVAMFVVTPF